MTRRLVVTCRACGVDCSHEWWTVDPEYNTPGRSSATCDVYIPPSEKHNDYCTPCFRAGNEAFHAATDRARRER